VLDWIVQKLFFAAPLTEGHRQTQLRMTNPALTWLRQLVLATEQSGKVGQWLRTHNLLDIVIDAAIEIPGASEADDFGDEETRERALRGIGKRLASCFGPTSNELQIDHLVIERREASDPSGRERKEYRVRPIHDPVCLDDFPAFPHTPHVNTTKFSAQCAVSARENEQCAEPDEKIKCAHTRGECGDMRERGADADAINALFAEAASEDWENLYATNGESVGHE